MSRLQGPEPEDAPLLDGFDHQGTFRDRCQDTPSAGSTKAQEKDFVFCPVRPGLETENFDPAESGFQRPSFGQGQAGGLWGIVLSVVPAGPDSQQRSGVRPDGRVL